MSRQILIVLAVSLFAKSTFAEPTRDSSPAATLVKRALAAEVDGNDSQRDELLAEAASLAPDEPSVRWQHGQVHFNKAWKRYDEIVAEATKSAPLQNYREQRDSSQPTLEAQLKLALFCQRMGLEKQSLAHWSAILELDPENARARKQLGFTNDQGRWVKAQDVSTERLKREKVAKTAAHLSSDLQALVKSLATGKMTVDEAAGRLGENAEAAAIPAWESFVAARSQVGASAVIAALARLDAPEASLALARQAVLSQWPNVREQASLALRGRDETSFIPPLLGELRGPWIGWREVATDGRNQLVHRFSVIADGPNQQVLRVLDEAYFLQGDRSAATLIAAQSSGQTSAQLESLRRQENIRINAQNERVMQTLAVATGETTFDSPQDWWRWWDDRNEVYSAGGKPLETSYAFRTASIVGSPPPPPISSVGSRPADDKKKKDCLAGGTPILTQRGPIAVERIRIGDLVLSQHQQTGEVSLQPVLRTTVREATNLIRITLGKQTLRASGGHPFWIVGEGWVRARDLKPGTRMHGLTQPVEIDAVEVEDHSSRSFNLVVNDFHSYYVGSGMILSHDNSVIEPVENRLPGL